MNDAHRDKALLAQNGCEYFARDGAIRPTKDGDQDRGDQSGYHPGRPSRVPFTVQAGDQGDKQTEKSRDNSHQPERSPQDHPDIPAGKIPKRRVIAGGTQETPQATREFPALQPIDANVVERLGVFGIQRQCLPIRRIGFPDPAQVVLDGTTQDKRVDVHGAQP
jgi:hypothetical protein